MIKKRSAGVAGLFNFMLPGLGYLYVGKPIYALLFPLVLLLPFGVFAWSRLILQPIGMITATVVMISIFIFGIVTAFMMAKCSEESEPKRFQRWYVYCLYLLFFTIFWVGITDNRALVFGYESHRVISGSMITL